MEIQDPVIVPMKPPYGCYFNIARGNAGIE